MGIVTFTCANKECGNQWSGGMRSEFSPGEVIPQTGYVNQVESVPIRNKEGFVVGYQEFVKPQSKNPTFKGGSLVPEKDE